MKEKERETSANKFHTLLSQGEVYVVVDGQSNGRNVVFVHGFSVPSFIWDRTAPALVDAGFFTIRYDLYGRGFSARPNSNHSSELYIGQLSELIAKLGLKGPVDLIGLSMGGIIATEFTVMHPEIVGNLVLIDPVGFIDILSETDRMRIKPGYGDRWWCDNGKEWLINNLENDLYDVESSLSDYRRKFLIQFEQPGIIQALLRGLRAGMLDSRAEIYSQLNELEKKILIIWGENDKVIDVSGLEVAKSLIRNLEYHVIPKASHIPQYERYEEVNPLIIDFLLKN